MSVIPFDRERPFPLRDLRVRLAASRMTERLTMIEFGIETIMKELALVARKERRQGRTTDPAICLYADDRYPEAEVVRLPRAG